MRSAPTETWFVWFSEEWTHTLVEVKFLDTTSGDTIVALRNNKGGPLSTGPSEHFVSVHPRSIQQKAYDGVAVFDILYSTAQDRVDRLTLFKETTPVIKDLDTSKIQIIGISDMLVLPSQKEDIRQPWVLLSVVVAPYDDPRPRAPTTQGEFTRLQEQAYDSFTDSYRVDICINLDMDGFMELGGSLPDPPAVCKLNNLFEIMRASSYNAVMLHRPKPGMRIDMALLPTTKGVDMCIVKMELASVVEMSNTQAKYCFTTPDSFSTSANFPLRNSWTDFQREMLLGVQSNPRTPSMTQQGTVVPANKIMAQNSLSAVDTASETESQQRVQVRVCILGSASAISCCMK